MAVLPVKRPGMGGGWGAPWVPGSAGNSLVLDTAASSLTRGCRLTPCSTAPRRYGVPLRLAAQRKAQAVRSASIVAVGTILQPAGQLRVQGDERVRLELGEGTYSAS